MAGTSLQACEDNFYESLAAKKFDEAELWLVQIEIKQKRRHDYSIGDRSITHSNIDTRAMRRTLIRHRLECAGKKIRKNSIRKSQERLMGFSDFLAGVYDNFIAIKDPAKAIRNAQLRNIRKDLTEFHYKAARQSRLHPRKIGLGGSGDRHLDPVDLYNLRELSRALDRDNCIAHGILDRAVEAIVGTGIPITFEAGQKTWNERAERLFEEWWTDEADVRGMQPGWLMEQNIFRSVKVDGDILVIKLKSGQIQVIEADRIVTPLEHRKDKFVINGIRIDEVGRPIHFYIAPDERITNAIHLKDTTKVDAKDVIYLANPTRFSQTRGVPVFATNMQLFEDIDAYIESTIVSAKVAASFVMFVKREDGGTNELEGSISSEDQSGDTVREQEVRPGGIMYGLPGEDAKAIASSQPSPNFDTFVTKLLRFSGLNFGMPLEMVSLDFSKTNYSSARAAMLLAHRSNMIQHKFMFNGLKAKLARWKIDQWIKEKKLEPRNYKVGTVPPRFPQIDPEKEAKADTQRVHNGFATHKEVCNQLGFDWRDSFRQRSLEIDTAIKHAKKLNKDGFVVDWRDIVGHPGSVVSPTEDEPENKEEPQENDDDK